jgi:hypothetical protein
MQRIEKLIGYKIYVAPLPAFIAEDNENIPQHRPASAKPERGKFKRRFNNKGRRQSSKD